jgi:glycosyltransferase involved in cell wall biosynthesis
MPGLPLSLMKEVPMLIAQMVGKNESNRYLRPVLERLSSQVDKIIFTDDCSDDDTADIAAEYATVYKTDKTLFTENEGNLRSQAWKNLEKHAKEGDWILAIDCDEMLYHEQNLEIGEVLKQSPFDVVNIRFFHMWNPVQYRVDKLWAPTNSSRLFRYRLGGTFFDRRLACGSEPTYVVDLIRYRNYWLESGLIMKHLGYIKDEDKKAKHERYMNLDKGEFHNINHIQSIIDENPVLLNWGDYK